MSGAPQVVLAADLEALRRRVDILEKTVADQWTEGLNLRPKGWRSRAAVDLVSDYYEVSREDLFGDLRETWLIRPRFTAIWLVREAAELSYPHIASIFGRRDHSTMMHACRRVWDWRKHEPEYRAMTDRMLEQLRKPVAREAVQ